MDGHVWMRLRDLNRRRFLRGLGAAAVLSPLLGGCGSNGSAGRSISTGGTLPRATAEARTASAPGVTAETITIGSIYPLTGPASSYAPIVQTIDAYFKMVNDGGGVNGRTIKFLIEDDQYSATRTPPLGRKLVEQDHIFALFGNLGTPTNSSIVDYTTDQRVPLLYIVSEAGKWGDARKYPYAMALQLAHPVEARILGRYVAGTWPGKKLGSLYQNDDFGKEYLGYKETAATSNVTVSEESYEPRANDVGQQIANLKSKGAEVLILGATPKVAGLALKAAADLGWKPAVVMGSVGADPAVFGLAGGAQNVEGAISDIWLRGDDGSAETQQVKDLLATYAPQVQFAQLAVMGYVIGLATVETLKRAGINPTRESLMTAAESFRNFRVPQLVPGSSLSTSQTDHVPVKSVQLTRAVGGRFVPFGEAIS